MILNAIALIFMGFIWGMVFMIWTVIKLSHKPPFWSAFFMVADAKKVQMVLEKLGIRLDKIEFRQD